MIVKHSTDETPKPTPVSLRLARVVSLGNGTVDVCPVGSSVVLHDIPVTSSGNVAVGDIINLQMMDNRRFAFATQSATTTEGETTKNVTIQNGDVVINGTIGGTTAHGLGDTGIHTGQLLQQQAPWAVPNTTTISTNSTSGLLGGGSLAGSLSLSIATATGTGLVIASNVLQLNSAVAGSGLTYSAGVLNVGQGNGIAVDADAVRVSLANTSGLTFSSGGLQIDDSVAGNGLAIAAKILSIGAGNGIAVDVNSIRAIPNTAKGIAVDSSGIAVDLASSSGLSFASGKLQLDDSVAGSGLAIGSKVLSVASNSGSLTIGANTVDVSYGHAFPWTNNHTWSTSAGVASSNAVSGFAGQGWQIRTFNNAGLMDLDELTVRGRLRVYELLIQQIRATNGSIFVTSSAKVASVVEGTGTYTITIDAKENSDFCPFVAGDLLRAQRVNLSGIASGTDIVWQSDLTVTSVSGLTFTATLRTGTTPPAAGMEYVRLGNTSNTSRQSSLYLTADDSSAPYMDVVTGVSSFTGANGWGTGVRARIGRLDGVTSGTNEYGIWAGTGTGVNNRYIRASNTALELRNVPIELYGNTGANPQVRLTAGSSNNTPSFAMGTTIPTSSIAPAGSGIWMGQETTGGAYTFRLGTVASGSLTEGILWNGSSLTVTGSINILGGNAETQTGAQTKATAAQTNAQSYSDTELNKIVSTATGRLAFAVAAAPTGGSGLYLGSTYLGYYSSGWKTYMDNTGSFFLSGSSGTQGLTWNSAANALSIDGAITARSGSIAGVLSIGTAGGIYQGSGTFSSPTTGVKLWNDSGTGRIAGYNSGSAQWYAGTDGRLYAGGGDVQMDNLGLALKLVESNQAAPQTANSVRWSESSSGVLGITATGTISQVRSDLATGTTWMILRSNDSSRNQNRLILQSRTTASSVFAQMTLIGNTQNNASNLYIDAHRIDISPPVGATVSGNTSNTNLHLVGGMFIRNSTSYALNEYGTIPNGSLVVSQQIYIGGTNDNTDVTLRRKSSNVLALGTSDALESTDYSGLSRGWRISSAGSAEFGDIRIRGAISSSVFNVDEVHASAGTLGLYQAASSLFNEFNVPAALESTVVVQIKKTDAGGSIVATGDVIHLRAWTSSSSSISSCWFVVEGTPDTSNSAYTQCTLRLKSGNVSNPTTRTYSKGTGVVNFGASGKSILAMSADNTVGAPPNVSFYTHTGTPWTSVNMHARIGNLKGYYENSAGGSDVYGFAAGNSTSTFVIADATNGFRVVNNTYSRFSVDLSGNVALRDGNNVQRIGLSSAGVIELDDSAGNARVLIDSGGLKLRDSNNNAVITLDSSGNSQFTGVMTIGTSGGIYQGTGTFASPTTGLKIWSETSGANRFGRIAGYNNGTLQWNAGTDGKLYAGGTSSVMDQNGISVEAGIANIWETSLNGYKFKNVLADTASIGLYANVISSSQNLWLINQTNYGNASVHGINIRADDFVQIAVGNGGINAGLSAYLHVKPNGIFIERQAFVVGGENELSYPNSIAFYEGNMYVCRSIWWGDNSVQDPGDTRLYRTSALNLETNGSFTSLGSIAASVGISGTTGTFTGGLNVGSATSAETGEIKTSGQVRSSGWTHIRNTNFTGSYTTTDSRPAIVFSGTDTGQAWFIGPTISDTSNATKLGFFSWRPGTGWVMTMDPANNGRVGIKTLTPSFELDVAGSIRATVGINVGSATGAATGDVKFSGSIIGTGTEGLRTTWTPTFEWSGGGTGTFTYDVRSAVYTKVANVVYIAARITLSAVTIGTSTGTLRIGGLPFTVANITPLPVASVGACANWTTNTPDRGIFFNNTTYIQLYSGPLTTQTIGTANVANTSSIYISGFYYT